MQCFVLLIGVRTADWNASSAAERTDVPGPLFKLRVEELLGVRVAVDPFVHLIQAVQRVVDAQAEHVAAIVSQLKHAAVEAEAVYSGVKTRT